MKKAAKGIAASNKRKNYSPALDRLVAEIR